MLLVVQPHLGQQATEILYTTSVLLLTAFKMSLNRLWTFVSVHFLQKLG